MTNPNLRYPSDTHYPWQEDEAIEGGKLKIAGGQLASPLGSILGVTLSHGALARLHRNYLDCGIRVRDDAKEMRKHRPELDDRRPRFFLIVIQRTSGLSIFAKGKSNGQKIE